MSGTTAFRLPQPPENYSQGFFSRLINALELDKRIIFFAATTASRNLSEESQKITWFMS